MLARKTICEIIEKAWVTPTVVRVRFLADRRISFDAGQFMSVVVPSWDPRSRPVRRAYSFGSDPSSSIYEIYVKHFKGGAGGEYLSRLEAGDFFTAFAPYGDFAFHPSSPRSICFISTGTGASPFRSMILSESFQENRPERVISIFGARSEEEILFPGFFESLGIESVIALSQPGSEWGGFKGRVTDYIRGLPLDWGWQTTDFYVCGNAAMVDEVSKILTNGRGVPETAIYQEVYFLSTDKKRVA